MKVFAINRAAFNQGKNAKYDISIDDQGVAQTLVAKGPGAVAIVHNAGGGKSLLDDENYETLVRRLTPLECCRLQGMPDWWCSEVPHKDAPEYKMWGNGMALPNVLFVFEGVRRVLLTRYISELLEAEK